MSRTSGRGVGEKAPGERRGRTAVAAAVGLFGALTLAGGAIATTAGASTFHDTWGRQLLHSFTAARPRAAAPKAGVAGRPRQFAAERPVSLGVRIASQQSPRAGGDAAAVLADLNAVRAQFGLAPARATTIGHALVDAAAADGTDPALLPVSDAIPEEFGIWGAVGGTNVVSPSAVEAVVNAWVFHDGWLGAATDNLDCTAPGAPGCNGHRDAVLSTPPVPGAQLYADVAVVPSTLSGQPAVSIAAQLIWVAP